MRVWVDRTNTADVVLRPLVELLEREGHEVLVTARALSHTVEPLEEWGARAHCRRAPRRRAARREGTRALTGRMHELVRLAAARATAVRNIERRRRSPTIRLIKSRGSWSTSLGVRARDPQQRS